MGYLCFCCSSVEVGEGHVPTLGILTTAAPFGVLSGILIRICKMEPRKKPILEA